jgi:hypothetical protein
LPQVSFFASHHTAEKGNPFKVAKTPHPPANAWSPPPDEDYDLLRLGESISNTGLKKEKMEKPKAKIRESH